MVPRRRRSPPRRLPMSVPSSTTGRDRAPIARASSAGVSAVAACSLRPRAEQAEDRVAIGSEAGRIPP